MRKSDVKKIIAALLAAAALATNAFAETEPADKPEPLTEAQWTEKAEELYVLREVDQYAFETAVEEMTDEDYAVFSEIFRQVEEQKREEQYTLEQEAEEALGTEYIRNAYGLDLEYGITQKVAQQIHTLEYTDRDTYTDIINNMTDVQYESYFLMDKYMKEKRLYVHPVSMEPFTYGASEIMCGDQIALRMRVDNTPVWPANLIFLIGMSDGSEEYVYISDPGLTFDISENAVKATYSYLDGSSTEYVFKIRMERNADTESERMTVGRLITNAALPDGPESGNGF